jgi:hypothetical protein
MKDDMLDALIGAQMTSWPYVNDSFIKRTDIGISSDEVSAITADQLRQIQDRMTQANKEPPVDWRARREHVAKFKETYVKLRADNIVLDHQTAIELAKVIYKESETITWEDTQ